MHKADDISTNTIDRSGVFALALLYGQWTWRHRGRATG